VGLGLVTPDGPWREVGTTTLGERRSLASGSGGGAAMPKVVAASLSFSGSSLRRWRAAFRFLFG